MSAPLTQQDIGKEIRRLGLSSKPVCVHASLRSFGRVEAGASAVVRAFLEERCTLMVPSFSWAFAVPPPPNQRFPRNGWNYEAYAGPTEGIGKIYSPLTSAIDKNMGAVPTSVVAHSERVRGSHPLCSFSAVGPLAADLVAGQSPSDVFAPLTTLADTGGFVALMGVDFRRLTLLHLAEKHAGRTQFRRWANNQRGRPIAVEVSSCSHGFGNLEPLLRNEITTAFVGKSKWKVLPARRALSEATKAIKAQPEITHCGDAECERCNDAVAGGPILQHV